MANRSVKISPKTMVILIALVLIIVFCLWQIKQTDSNNPGSSSLTLSDTLKENIESLPVNEERRGGYDRDLFQHWIDENQDGCNTRYEVLIRQNVNPDMSVSSGCYLTDGWWVSAYDGVETSNPSEFDVDHFVPLAEAWGSGADTWTQEQRTAYANDLVNPYSLIAVSASSNRSKSDSDVSEWVPEDNICAYVARWVIVKKTYHLSVDEVEKQSLVAYANDCANGPIEELAQF